MTLLACGAGVAIGNGGQTPTLTRRPCHDSDPSHTRARALNVGRHLCLGCLQVAMVNSRLALAGGVAGGVAGPCAGCGGRIADRFLLFSMERYWHTRCLRCSCCRAQLGRASRSCYSRGGLILCRDDYVR